MYKIWRSPYSSFAGLPANSPDEMTDETITAENVYSEEELESIAALGFNALWIHGLLHHLVSVEPYPELGGYATSHQVAVNRLVTAAAKHGIKVFIYLQPPRAIERSLTGFWDKHYADGGIDVDLDDGAELRTLCTSRPNVKSWLKRASSEIMRTMPGLAGVILICNSEFPSHCLNCNSVSDKPCPACSKRSAAEVISEIITLVRDGIREVSKTAEIIAWNWCWEMASPEEIIRNIPEDVIVMSDFERNGYMDIPGYPNFHFTEYSLAFPGPCKAFKETRRLTEKYPHRLMAKLQLGTTHELASVVCLPAVYSIFDKADYLRKNPMAGFMGCWNFGNMASTNVRAFNYFLSRNTPKNKTAAVKDFAEQFFPRADARLLTAAWDIFRQALLYYPNIIPVLYRGPQNYTLAYTEIYEPMPLKNTPTGRSWHFDPRGDDFSGILNKVFTLDEIIERFSQVSAVWAAGTTLIESALCGKYIEELANAKIVDACFASTVNTLRIFRMRRKWNDTFIPEFKRIAGCERQLLEAVLPWVEADPRQGYHAEPHGWMFDASGIRNKIKHLSNIGF